MSSLVRIFVDVIIALTIFGVVFFLYQNYSGPVINYLYGEQKLSIFLRDVPVLVTPVVNPEERQKGLSGVTALPENEGMLFIFEEEGRYGFWMKDTLLSLDIIWINNNQEIVHIERNVRPESYPATYYSPVPARFVVEVNAFFTSTFNINVGDKVTIPKNNLPADLR
ncbi:hypothetical protein COU14_01320 [Candidatus Kaiserbacteria bacterium CG10_big_fil_rev_8_21_14_0_10_44_10]|uniref:DUF192 domain-containing protein n=1 Tax=Candidatus Kaiserbacteria bacterium CG10_big_fil_rev_8_21_14_0_10_44_10 TaxID=1974606 RepID=A0A2H0UHW2_9BACT|nr:MAG: hypothetical protein COU14_01320 [Candidatus Kaiserbacteria bacterium CG10_big_fil_rev_8_21_14_0_10_44_10]